MNFKLAKDKNHFNLYHFNLYNISQIGSNSLNRIHRPLVRSQLAPINADVGRISPPRREFDSLSAGTEDGKGEDE